MNRRGFFGILAAPFLARFLPKPKPWWGEGIVVEGFPSPDGKNYVFMHGAKVDRANFQIHRDGTLVTIINFDAASVYR